MSEEIQTLPQVETTLTKLVKSISGSLDELVIVESGLTKLTKSISKKYLEKLEAAYETQTLDETAEHFKLLTTLSLAVLDTKRKLLIKGIADPEPAPKELLELFKVVNTPEKRLQLEKLLETFAKSDEL